MYGNILSPVDDSEGSSEILHHVGELANWVDATTHLLFVADTTRNSVTVVENAVVDVLVQEGEGTVEDANKILSTLEVEYETDVVQGNPAPIIVEYADRYGYDLVAMSTYGWRGVSWYLQGSVSEKVVCLSSVPVFTARIQPDEQLIFLYENVLITTDGSADAARAAQHGLVLAESLGATIHVLLVVDDVPLSLDIRSTIFGQEHEQAATEAVKKIVEDTETYGVTDTVQRIERGDPADVILDCIDVNDIHAAAMGTTGRRGMDRILLGSVAEKMVRLVPVPMFTIGGIK